MGFNLLSEELVEITYIHHHVGKKECYSRTVLKSKGQLKNESICKDKTK